MRLGARSLFMGAALALLGAGCDCGGNTTTCEGDDECPVDQQCLDGRCEPLGDGGRRMDSGASPADAGPRGDAGNTRDGGVLPPGECRIEPSAQPFENPSLDLHWDATGLVYPNYSQAIHSPVVIDFIPEPLDSDVVPELVFLSYQDGTFNAAVLRVVSGRPPYDTLLTLAGDGMGPVLNEAMHTPSFLQDCHPAAGDLDGDGVPEIVASLRGGGAIALHNDGTELWRVTAADLPNAEISPNGSWAIHDLDGDGQPEVVVGRTVLEGRTGAVRFIGTGARGRNGQGPLSCVADVVASSPGQEVIAGHTVYAATGEILWEATDATDGFCAVADILDASGAAGRDGAPEVIRVANGRLRVHEAETGNEVANLNITCPGGLGAGRVGAPTVADFDGDGRMEVGVAGSNCYAVMDPECTGGGGGCLAAGILWATRTQDTSSNVTSSTVFDFNGDGRAEVVYNDEENFLVLDGVDGTIIFMEPNPSRTRTEQPIVADVDNDGNAEIVFTANNEASFAGDTIPRAERIPGVEIWSSADDNWVGAAPIWNQHTYHITHTNPAGTIASPEPASWSTHNTYRLNLPIEDALAAPDLTADTVSTDNARCGETPPVLQVCAQIFNRGDVRVGPGLEVVFYQGDPTMGGTEIGRATTTSNIDRGTFVTVCIDWAGAPLTPTRVFIDVDTGDAVRECVEDNNLVDLGEVACNTIM